MLYTIALLLFFSASSIQCFPSAISPRDTNIDPVALIRALHAQGSTKERLAVLLPDPSNPANMTYTFVNNTVLQPTGGTIALSAVDAFPALAMTNTAMAIGFVNPCGLNVPHSHPRANEFLTVVQGTLTAGFILESNPGNLGNVAGQAAPATGVLPQINATLGLYQGMIFPQGTIHWQWNPTCQPAIFAAAFDNNDPGRQQLARTFFSITDDEVLETALGNPETLDVAQLEAFKDIIPSSYAETMKECAKRCGIMTS